MMPPRVLAGPKPCGGNKRLAPDKFFGGLQQGAVFELIN